MGLIYLYFLLTKRSICLHSIQPARPNQNETCVRFTVEIFACFAIFIDVPCHGRLDSCQGNHQKRNLIPNYQKKKIRNKSGEDLFEQMNSPGRNSFDDDRVEQSDFLFTKNKYFVKWKISSRVNQKKTEGKTSEKWFSSSLWAINP